MNACQEYELILRLHEDDVSAFEALYVQYHHAIYYNVLKLVRDEQGAEDIVQEVFIALWEKRKEMDSAGIANWLFVVSYNRAAVYLRQKLRQSLLATPPDTAADTTEPRYLQLEERLTHLQEALEQLSPQRRKVFELCKIQGKTYEETARELQLSRHTVKEYLSAAIAGIKEYLQQHYHQEALVFFVVTGYQLLVTGHW